MDNVQKVKVYQNVYGFNPKYVSTPMGGCPTYNGIVKAITQGIAADTEHEPYCGTLEYVLDGNYVVAINFFPKSPG